MLSMDGPLRRTLESRCISKISLFALRIPAQRRSASIPSYSAKN